MRSELISRGLRLATGVLAALALVSLPATASSASKASRAAVGEIAFSVKHGDGDSPWDIYVVRTDGHWVLRKTTRLQEADPVWSPDGRHIAFDAWSAPPDWAGQHPKIYTMNPDGSHRRRLAQGWSPQWSPDGRRIAYDGSDGVYVMNADGTGKNLLARGGGPHWSPDGKQIAFTRAYDVYIVNAGGGGEHRLTRTGSAIVEAWTRGRTIVIELTQSASSGAPAPGTYMINADGTGLRMLRPPTDYFDGWSPDGKLLVYPAPHGGISTWRPSDGSVRRVTRGSDDDDPTWDPRGREIAFARNGLPRTRGIWIIDRDGSTARRIAAAPNPYGFGGPNLYGAPSWAPR